MKSFYNDQVKFPEPMNKNELLQCFEDIRNGNQDARNKLVERNLKLVKHIVAKFYNIEIDYDDLFSIGSYGLLKASRTFDVDKDIKFATYASTCITNEILMVTRKLKPGKEVSINEPMAIDSQGNELFLEDLVGVNDETIENIVKSENIKVLYKALQMLETRDRELIENRYMLKSDYAFTQRELVNKLGFRQSYISRIEKKALQKLTQNFNELVNAK